MSEEQSPVLLAASATSTAASSALQNSRLTATLMSEFQRCLTEQTFVDVRIYGADLAQSVRCHRVLLGAVSTLLRTALLDVEDENEVAIVIPDMSIHELTSVVECIYYGQHNLPDAAVLDWLVQFGICGREEVNEAVMQAQLIQEQEQDDQQDAEMADDAEEEMPADLMKPNNSAKGNLHTCNYEDACVKSFPSRHRLDLHRKQAHGLQPPPSDLTCTVCLVYRAKTRDAFEVHVRSRHNGERPFHCKETGCDKSFAALSYLDQHADVHNAEKVHACPLCPKRFQSMPSLSQHKATHEGKKFRCAECDVEFSTMRYLRQHNANKHRNKEVEQGVSCHVCDKVLSRKYELQCHMRTHTLEKPYKCSECPFTCRTRNTLNTHVKYVHASASVVAAAAKFACDVCGRRFRQTNDLRKHLRTHTMEKPFKCEDCGKAFARADYRKKHMRMHMKKAAKGQLQQTAAPGIDDEIGDVSEDISNALLGEDILGESVALESLGPGEPIELQVLEEGRSLPSDETHAEDGEEEDQEEEKRRAVYFISNQT